MFITTHKVIFLCFEITFGLYELLHGVTLVMMTAELLVLSLLEEGRFELGLIISCSHGKGTLLVLDSSIVRILRANQVLLLEYGVFLSVVGLRIVSCLVL